jgi:hypothetical protein
MSEIEQLPATDFKGSSPQSTASDETSNQVHHNLTSEENSLSLQAICDELSLFEDGTNDGPSNEPSPQSRGLDTGHKTCHELEAYWRSRYEVVMKEKIQAEAKLMVLQQEKEDSDVSKLRSDFDLLKKKYNINKGRCIKTQEALIKTQEELNTLKHERILNLAHPSMSRGSSEEEETQQQVTRKREPRTQEAVATPQGAKPKVTRGRPPKNKMVTSTPKQDVDNALYEYLLSIGIAPGHDGVKHNGNRTECGSCHADLSTLSQAALYHHQIQTCPAKMATKQRRSRPSPANDVQKMEHLNGTRSTGSGQSSAQSSALSSSKKRFLETPTSSGYAASVSSSPSTAPSYSQAKKMRT